MNIERDKFLDEQMECSLEHVRTPWLKFGIRWEWAQKQEWFYSFTQYIHGKDSCLTEQYNCFWDIWNDFFREYAHPDRFADALYSFLKERK